VEHLEKVQPGSDARNELGLNHELLRQALARMNEDQREVVLLRFVVGLPIADVARSLHKSEDAVKGLQRRGLSALKDSLNDMQASDV
jgi:RNA polymerase sigma factor (sigma-70 family)